MTRKAKYSYYFEEKDLINIKKCKLTDVAKKIEISASYLSSIIHGFVPCPEDIYYKLLENKYICNDFEEITSELEKRAVKKALVEISSIINDKIKGVSENETKETN